MSMAVGGCPASQGVINSVREKMAASTEETDFTLQHESLFKTLVAVSLVGTCS